MSQPAPAPAVDPSIGDAAITAEREETKYLLPLSGLDPLLATLGQRILPHRFVGEGANRLPDAHHFVTTVYFDTPSRHHFRAAVGDMEHNIKVRAKEYYDLHPSLAELATTPDQIARYQPWVWIEMKRRDGTRTRKRRFRLPKREIPAVFGGGGISGDALLHEAERETALAGVSELVEYGERLGEPLTANCLVNYRRLSFQEPDGSLRITVDLGLAFYAVPSDLWSREQALVRGALGRARSNEQCAVVEVKRRMALPAWLTQTLDAAGAKPAAFSKFVAAAGVVHGPG
ncbi:MAG TPA: VTC domain-containing protein [Polyangiaceae bacterium]|nr:VTC domain-containing protein [Polyangiaceae bacterium]